MSSADHYEIQVFSKPGRCVQCNAVKKRLTDLGAQFTKLLLVEHDGTQTEEAAAAIEMAKQRGLSSAPVVLLKRDGELVDLFAGNNPVKTKDFAETLLAG